MSGLIALPAEPASPAGTAIEAGPFWPAIDLNRLRDAFRIGTIVTHVRLENAVEGAILAVIRELADWQALQESAGHATLADVPSQAIGSVTAHVVAWRRAVGYMVMADLAETHRDIGATDNGAPRAEAAQLAADDYRRMATHAIRDILKTSRTAVEMI